MTDRAQFEAMLEALINEDHESAKEIFHNIVVGKSREIYEELLAEDFSQDSGNPYGKTEGMEEEEESVEEEGMEEEGAEEEESAGEEEESDDSEEPADDEEGDDTDSEEDPFGGDEEGDDEMGGEGDIEDRVMDLEDALEDLKAEFEQLMAGEEGEEHMGGDMGADMGSDMGADMGSDMGADMGGEMDELQGLMEYVNKVAAPKHGDNGANTKSLIDNMKNDMGGSSSNIAQNHVEVHGDAGTKAGGTKGGLLKPTTADLTAGLDVHNRPGKTDAGKKGFKKTVNGGGIDRQKGFEASGKMVGSGNDGAQRGEQNKQSILRPLKK